MAKLYLSEYSSQGLAESWAVFRIEVAQEPSQVDQVLTFTSDETKSTAFLPTTKFIRIHTDTACSIAVGPNPTATVNNKRLAANSTEYFGVMPGNKLSVISN